MAYGERERRMVLLACCAAGFVAPLLSTMMNLSLLSIGEEFGEGSHSQAYINTAFLLSSVVFMVPLAKFADIHGKRRVFIMGVSSIAVASVLAVFSPSFWFLILCRGVMGFGSAAVVTSSISMITDVHPPEHRGGAIGLHTMCVYIGLAAGPPLGGFLNQYLGWHSVFLVVLPFAVAAVVLMLGFKGDIAPDRGQPMDVRGSLVYALAIVLTMGGVINLPELWAVAFLLAGLVFLWLFVRIELRTPNHLLNMRLFRNRVFSSSCLATFMNYAASYSVSFFVALYLQSIGNLTSTEAGLLMLVQPAVQAVLTPYFGRRSDYIQDKRVLPTAGLLVSAVGLGMVLTFHVGTSLSVVAASLVVIGFGFSMFSAPNTSLMMGSVDRSETSEASAMVAVMRQTGMMVSMGIAMLFISVVMGSTENLSSDTYGDFVTVIRYSFAICVAMSLVAAAASWMRAEGSVASKEV